MEGPMTVRGLIVAGPPWNLERDLLASVTVWPSRAPNSPWRAIVVASRLTQYNDVLEQSLRSANAGTKTRTNSRILTSSSDCSNSSGPQANAGTRSAAGCHRGSVGD